MTVDQLLAAIKSRAQLPTFQGNTWNDAAIIAAMNEELKTAIVPKIVMEGEDYLVDFIDSPLVPSVGFYVTPSRALAGVVRKVSYVDVSGNEGPPLKRILLTDLGQFGILAASSPPVAFYFTAEGVNLVPTPDSNAVGSLRMYYLRAAPDLVNDSIACLAGVGLSADTTSGQVTTTAPPGVSSAFNANWISGLAAPKAIDVIQALPPHRVLAKDLPLTAVAAVPGTIAASSLAGKGFVSLGAVNGDFITPARKSYLPMVPDEFHVLLELRTAARILDSLGDMAGASSINQQGEIVQNALVNVISPRAKGNSFRFNAHRNW